MVVVALGEQEHARKLGYMPELSPRGLYELDVGTFRQEILTGGKIIEDWSEWCPVSVDDACGRLLTVQMLCKYGGSSEREYDGLRIDKQSWRADALIRCMDIGGPQIIDEIIERSQDLPGGEDCYKAHFLSPAIEEAFFRAAENCPGNEYVNLAALKEKLLQYGVYSYYNPFEGMESVKKAITSLPEDSKLIIAYDKLNEKLAA